MIIQAVQLLIYRKYIMCMIRHESFQSLQVELLCANIHLNTFTKHPNCIDVSQKMLFFTIFSRRNQSQRLTQLPQMYLSTFPKVIKKELFHRFSPFNLCNNL